ncbi:hypothetical protein [Stakelama tenebrarum]|uniref:Uncharacterized protein n=1 Tax=Stakelama tenebrarum TaxID=2711215 RepID=A0A6G6Y2Q7_9SPHN|nr:hypothetical protein [Sphingosinithalassobacter tenebrarum]QIG79212.1 hypothetical protein G5C33_05005 [Sphingosinithalassobacter tenebrarum]
MTPKQQRLIKDIASLFVKYDVKDWEVVIGALSSTDTSFKSDLLVLIKEISAEAAKKKSTSKAATKPTNKPALSKRKQLTKRLEALRNALASKSAFATTSEIRRFAALIGLKEDLPDSRPEAIEQIISRLADKPDDQVKVILSRVNVSQSEKSNFDDEFSRWAAVILKSA